MKKDMLFKGCTRPAMFLGVPYTPFFIGAGGCLLLAMYINLFILIFLPLVILVLRQIAKQDEMVFRLLGLRLKLALRVRNRGLRQGDWVFTPNHYNNLVSANKRKS